MNWKEFKTFMESKGINDETNIVEIDIMLPTKENIEVNLDSSTNECTVTDMI